jgi:hypothetical protein
MKTVYCSSCALSFERILNPQRFWRSPIARQCALQYLYCMLALAVLASPVDLHVVYSMPSRNTMLVCRGILLLLGVSFSLFDYEACLV